MRFRYATLKHKKHIIFSQITVKGVCRSRSTVDLLPPRHSILNFIAFEVSPAWAGQWILQKWRRCTNILIEAWQHFFRQPKFALSLSNRTRGSIPIPCNFCFPLSFGAPLTHCAEQLQNVLQWNRRFDADRGFWGQRVVLVNTPARQMRLQTSPCAYPRGRARRYRNQCEHIGDLPLDSEYFSLLIVIGRRPSGISCQVRFSSFRRKQSLPLKSLEKRVGWLSSIAQAALSPLSLSSRR